MQEAELGKSNLPQWYFIILYQNLGKFREGNIMDVRRIRIVRIEQSAGSPSGKSIQKTRYRIFDSERSSLQPYVPLSIAARSVTTADRIINLTFTMRSRIRPRSIELTHGSVASNHLVVIVA